jgi:hypothetical protein
MSKSECWQQANQEAQAEAKRGEHTPDNGQARREYADRAINAYASNQKTIAELREALSIISTNAKARLWNSTSDDTRDIEVFRFIANRSDAALASVEKGQP